MKLLDIFEQALPTPPLDIKLRDLHKIQTRIGELEQSLHNSEYLQAKFPQMKQLGSQLDKLKKRVALKISYMQKLKSRPTASEAKIMEILNSECSDWLKIVRDHRKFLYGVMDYNSPDIFLGNSNTTKQSLISDDAQLDQKIDEVLSTHGFQALNKNSISTTTDAYKVHNLWGPGKPYIIFPKNGFHWFTTQHRDLQRINVHNITDLDLLYSFQNSLITELKKKHPQRTENWHDVLQTKNEYNFFANLQDNFNKGNPLMLPDEYNKTIWDFVTETSILQAIQPGDIDSSMRLGTNILINGEYWAFNKNKWAHFLFKKIGSR